MDIAGWLTIGIKTDRKSFEEEIRQTEAKLRKLEQAYNKALSAKGKYKPSEQALANLRQEIEKTSNKLVDLQSKQDKLSQTEMGGAKNRLEDINNSLSGIIKKVVRWGLAVFGVRSAYMFIRQAMSTLSSENEQLSADINYIKSALAHTIEPIILTIISWVKTLLQYIGYIVKMLTGKNIFANANKGLQKANKSATKLSKTLAGFDEMNVLQDSSSGGGGDSGGMPSFDLSNIVDFSKFDPIAKLKEILAKVREWIYSIDWQQLGSDVYNKIKEFFTNTDWAGIFESIFETIGAVFGALGGFIVGFLKEAWKDITDYFGEWIEKSREMGGDVIQGILLGILNAIYQIGKWIYDHIFTPFINGFKKAFGIASPSKVMMEMGGYIVDGLKNGLINIWGALKSIFENLKTSIINVFKSLWNGIKNIFSTVGSFFGNIVSTIYNKFKDIGYSIGQVIGNTFKSAINAVLKVAESVLNTPIRAINNLIGTINKVPGINLTKLSTFSLPRLAKGGIINMPGRGVAIGGESGAEGVIPLTDSQQMSLLGEAIGKYISISPTIPIYLGNRLIAKEVRKIEAEDNFAYNR